MEGDEAEAWRLGQNALASAFTAEQLYLDALAPAMRIVGDEWEAGRISVAEEHRASTLAYRLVGRLGPSFTRRGPARGSSCSARPPATGTASRSALLADPLRGRGFTVADLGADTPAASFAEIVANEERDHCRRHRRLRRRGRSRRVGDHRGDPFGADVPVLLGGRTITDAAHATCLGADAYSDSAAGALAWFEAVNARASSPRS